MPITCTILKSGRSDKFGRPLIPSQSYTGEIDEIRALVMSGFASVSDASALDDDSTPGGYVAGLIPSGSSAVSATKTLTGGIEVSAGSTNLRDVFASQVSGGYYCHLFAADSSNGDAVVPDISGAQAHGAFGSGMTKAIAWGTSGFASTNNALSFQNFVMPAINWDYLNGESLIVTWKGRGTPPASTKAFLANSIGSSDPGFALRVQADGRIQMYISGGTGVFLQPSVLVAFEASITHSFSVVIDGLNRKYSLVEDGVESRSMALIDSGNNIDTRTTDALLLGTQDVTGVASNAVISQTQALIILRGRVGKGLPENWLELVKAIQRNPGRLVTADQW